MTTPLFTPHQHTHKMGLWKRVVGRANAGGILERREVLVCPTVASSLKEGSQKWLRKKSRLKT